MAGPASELERLVRYTAWANERLYACVARLPPAQRAVRSPIFAGSVLHTLNHVRLIDVVWQSHLRGVPHGFTTRNPDTTPTFEELHAMQQALDAWYADYARALTTRAAGESVNFRFINGGDGTMTRAEILFHVVNHTTYHRGHITAMLYQAGIQPPVTDLPVFCRTAAGAGA